MNCKLSLASLAQRMVMKSYQGPTVGTVGSLNNYGYVSSDVVPPNCYWLVMGCDVTLDGSAGSDPAAGIPTLYLLNPTAVVPPNANVNGSPAAYGQQKIFLSHKGGNSDFTQLCNSGPLDPTMAMKIDDAIGLDVTTPTGSNSVATWTMLRGGKPRILPAGWALLATNWFQANTDGPIGVVMSMRLLIAQLKSTETVDAW